MKIQANIILNRPESGMFDCKVNVDTDYVEDNADSVKEYIANELADMFGHSFGYDEFEVTNLQEILEDLAYDEFEDKTQYADM